MRPSVLRKSGIQSPLDDIGCLLLFPLQKLLTRSVRALAISRPELFLRLGRFKRSVYLLAPTDFPLAFRLIPDGSNAQVTIVPRRSAGPYTVRVSASLTTLVGLFDGTRDADSSVFSRAMELDGATEAAVALHNVLEAADLAPSDLFQIPAPASLIFNRLAQSALDRC